MKDSEFLHLVEGRRNLHQPAELDRLVEISRGRDDERKDDRKLGVTGGEPGQLLAADDDPPPIRHDPCKAGLERVQLARFAAVEGDVLGVLAQSDHAETEIRLVTLLVEAKPDQRVADPSCQQSAGDRVDQRGEDHVTRDFDQDTPAERNRQRTGQRPQNCDERRESHKGTQKPKRQPQSYRREPVEIIGNSLIWIVGRRVVQLHPVISLVLQPVAQKTISQPAAPADVQYLPKVKRVDGNNDQQEGDDPENCELAPELRPVVLLQGIIEVVVPGIETDIESDGDQVQRYDSEQQPARRPFLVGIPIRPRKGPGLPQEPLLGHHCHYYLRRSRPA